MSIANVITIICSKDHRLVYPSITTIITHIHTHTCALSLLCIASWFAEQCAIIQVLINNYINKKKMPATTWGNDRKTQQFCWQQSALQTMIKFIFNELLSSLIVSSSRMPYRLKASSIWGFSLMLQSLKSTSWHHFIVCFFFPSPVILFWYCYFFASNFATCANYDELIAWFMTKFQSVVSQRRAKTCSVSRLSSSLYALCIGMGFAVVATAAKCRSNGNIGISIVDNILCSVSKLLLLLPLLFFFSSSFLSMYALCFPFLCVLCSFFFSFFLSCEFKTTIWTVECISCDEFNCAKYFAVDRMRLW